MRLMPIRLYYFAAFAGMGAVVPYFSVYFNSAGMSGAQIGLLYMVQSALLIVTAPLTGRAADAVARPERVLAGGLLLSAAAAVLLGMSASVLVIIAMSTVLRVASDSVMPLGDGLAVSQARSEEKLSYGSIRNFGSAGWIVIAPAAGLVAQRVGTPVVFGVFAVAMFFAALLALRAARDSRAPGPDESSAIVPDAGSIRTMMESRLLRLSVIALFVHGIFRQALFRFEPMYLDQLGVQLGGIGAAASIPAILELVGMPLAGRVAARRGPEKAIIVGMALTMFRVAAVALWPIPAVIVATKAIEGVAFAFETVGVVELVGRQAAPGMLRATMALFTVSLVQVIAIVGNPIAGFVMDAAGAHPLYLLSLGGSTAGLLIMLLSGRRSRSDHHP